MESYALPNPAYPTELSEISLALFTDLQEAALLRERLIKASTMEGEEGLTERSTLNFAFLDAKMIVSRSHLLAAAHQAILSAAQGDLHTQTVHSEVISHLNPTSNVAEGLRRFGINAKSTSVLLLRIGPKLSPTDKEALQDCMQKLVKGNLSSLDELENSADLGALKKIYKLGNDVVMSTGLLTSLTAANKTVGVS